MQLLDAINRFYFHMTVSDLQALSHETHGQSISYHSLLYLDLINYRENCTVSDLAKLLGVSLPAVTSKVGELLRQGYVTKTQSQQDRRVHYLALTQEAQEIFNSFDRRMLKAAQAVMASRSQEQIDCFCDILDLISKQYLEEQENE